MMAKFSAGCTEPFTTHIVLLFALWVRSVRNSLGLCEVERFKPDLTLAEQDTKGLNSDVITENTYKTFQNMQGGKYSWD